jgi:general secretion pathway protein L
MKLRALWDWWVSQLADWVPETLRQRLADRRDVLVIVLGRHEMTAHAVVDGTRHEIGGLGHGPADRQRTTLSAAVAGLPRRPADVELRLEPGEYLRRDFDLPLAAEDNLREAVELQLDRLTPFNADAVVFQCGIRERDPAAKRLGVWMAAAPAGHIHQLLDWLGEPRNLMPRPTRAPPLPDQPFALRYALRREKRTGVRWVLVVANVALLVAAVVVHLQNRDAELGQLQDAVAKVRRDAAEAGELSERADQLRGAASTLVDRRTARPQLVEVLEDLSRRLPDDTYLQRFEVHQSEVRLFGVSAAATNLIRLLEESPLLADVRFESSVTRDAATGKERFNIVARLVSATRPPFAGEKTS